MNAEGEKLNAWIQLDFNQIDDHGILNTRQFSGYVTLLKMN
jgi:hypothetical protein